MTTVSSVSAADQVRDAFDFEIAKVAYRPDESLGWKAPAGVYGLHRNDTGEPLDVGTVTSLFLTKRLKSVVISITVTMYLLRLLTNTAEVFTKVVITFSHGWYVSRCVQ